MPPEVSNSRPSAQIRLTVCIATFQRNERLSAVLDDLAKQIRLPEQVVVVDNDSAAGARVIVERYRAGVSFPVEYDVQPEPNISITRNRTVQLARGDWIAFIDDDERAPPEWLSELLRAAELYGADGVLAPVEPQVPASAPDWIRRGRFYDFEHQPEGAAVPYNSMRFGNVLLRAAPLLAEKVPFDPSYGLTAGEDTDLLIRLAKKGAKIVWTERAPVFEPVEPKRLSLRFLSLRAFSGGQGFARYTLAGGYQPLSFAARMAFFPQVFVQLIASSCMAFIVLPFGWHRSAEWLIRACANYGKLSLLWGGRYVIYGRTE